MRTSLALAIIFCCGCAITEKPESKLAKVRLEQEKLTLKLHRDSLDSLQSVSNVVSEHELRTARYNVEMAKLKVREAEILAE